MNPVRIALVQAVFAACVAAVAIGVAGTAAYAARTAIVQVDRLNLRSEPSRKSRSVAVLPRETLVTVIDRRDKWLKVRYKNKTGYLRYTPRYVKLVSTEKKASNTRQDMIQVREKARTLEKKIKSSEAAVVSYNRKETNVIRSLDQIGRSLDKARQRVAATRAELSQIDSDIQKNQRDLDQLEKRIATAEAYAAGRLVALYKLGWLGRINILASAESVGDMLQRERALSMILDQDEQHLAVLERDHLQLEALQLSQRKRKAAKQALENEHRRRAGAMLTEKQRKSSVLNEIRSKKSLELAAIEVFKQDARNLDRAIEALGRTIARDLEKAVIEKEASREALPQRFVARKGLLKLPVNGKIKNSFGAYHNRKFNTRNFRSGIDITADRGEPVHAVFSGRVLYSNWFKGYGNMLIIDHGEHYYTVYAHVEEIFKQKGDVVEDNEVIATVGDTGSLAGPGLYFEVRYHGKPLDPAKWIKKG